MAHRPYPTITAKWECVQIELPDDDLTRDTLILAPSYFFGKLFHVTAVEDAPDVEAGYPRRKTATATVGYLLYALMLRFQQGSEATGNEPSLWSLVDGSAIDDDTGRQLEVGEIPPLFP